MLLTTARANTVPCARQSSGITRLSKGGFLIAPRKFRKLCSISESLRTWFHISNCHQYSKSQLLSVGIFLPVPPLKTVMTSRASLRRRPDFPPDSRKFLSLLSVGTRALATSLRVFTTTYRQQVRQVFWSGGGESENKRHGVPEFTLVPADFAEDPAVGIRPRFLSPLPSSLRSSTR